MFDSIKIAFQYITPKHLISRIVGKLAAAEAGGLTTALIKLFIIKKIKEKVLQSEVHKSLLMEIL